MIMGLVIVPSSMMPMSGKAVVQAATTLNVSKWTEYTGNPVFGSASSLKAYYPSIIKISDNDYRMWYGSSSGVSYATSSDGLVWTEGTNPVSGLINANHPLVKYIGDKFKIWYWDTAVSIYTIGALKYAESDDGTNWASNQALTQDDTCELITGANTGWNRGSYGPGDVIYNSDGSTSLDDDNIWNNKYVMYYMATDGGNEYIGLAYSLDGKHWKRYGDNPVLRPCTEDNDPSVGWDYCSVGYPTVMKLDNGTYVMWYSGGPGTNHGIGFAYSSDGVNWIKDKCNPILHKSDGVSWRNERTYTPSVIKDGNIYKMWFSGQDSSGKSIGYATANGPFPSIQSAIDTASAGDTINVAAGIYDEGGLKISNKSLTIIGIGDVTITGTKGSFDTDLKFHGSSAPRTSVFGSMDYVVGVCNEADVDFVNITIDGADNLLEAASNQYFAGVAFYNAQGSLSNCEIKRTASNPATSDGASVSIYIDTDSGSWELEVSDCTFNTWPRNAISAYGSGTTLSNVLTVDVDDSTFTGREGTGPQSGLQNGITVQAGVDLEVDNCTFSALSRPAGTGGSVDLCISGGYGYKSNSASYAPAHDVTVNNCTFYISGDKYIRRSAGVWITTTGMATVSNCTFTNMKGIIVDGSNDCNGDSGNFNPSSQDVTIKDCEFNGPSYPSSIDYYMYGVNMQYGAQVGIENCTFNGFDDNGSTADGKGGDGVCFNSAHTDPYYTGSCGGSVTGCTFSGCSTCICSSEDVTPLTISNNNFDGSNEYGVYNSDTTPDEIIATNNWWGHASGPGGEYGRVNKQGKIIGKGDAVSNYVNWDPWLSQPIPITPQKIANKWDLKGSFVAYPTYDWGGLLAEGATWEYSIHIKEAMNGDFSVGSIYFTTGDIEVNGIVEQTKSDYAYWSKSNLAAAGRAEYDGITYNFLFLYSETAIWFAISQADLEPSWTQETVWDRSLRAYQLHSKGLYEPMDPKNIH